MAVFCIAEECASWRVIVVANGEWRGGADLGYLVFDVGIESCELFHHGLDALCFPAFIVFAAMMRQCVAPFFGFLEVHHAVHHHFFGPLSLSLHRWGEIHKSLWPK